MEIKKFKGYIKDIDFNYIQEELMKIPEFSDFKSWKIKKLNVGEMHHTYLFIRGKKKYFVKEVKPHEAQANYYLCALNLTHLPHAVYPELLKKKILVMNFVEGKMLKERKISLDLFRDFITFQNKLNIESFRLENNPLQINNYCEVDDGFFKKSLDEEWNKGKENLLNLKKKYDLKVIDNFLEIVNFLSKDREKIIDEFSKIPFARQHHDFREDNILINKDGQFLIDWGSSYGYGPFIYDYSKFIVYDKKAFNLLMKNSDICKNTTKEKVERWLYLGLVKKMFNLLKWYLPEGHHYVETKSKTKKRLEYEYKTYKYLIEKNFLV